MHEKGLHSSLDFEDRRVKEAQMQLEFINNVVWACEGEFGDGFVKEHIYSYGCGIEFKDLRQDQYSLCKDIITRFTSEKVGKYKKESNKWGLQLSTYVIIGEVETTNFDGEKKMKKLDTTVAFKWGLPDTCELIEVSKQEEIKQPVYTDSNGKTFKEVTYTEVKCNKPILEAVFQQQEDEPVNV